MTFNSRGLAVAKTAFAPIPHSASEMSRAASAACRSQDKVRFAVVDSGGGGAMSTAFLRGPVRALASYYCLPIGDKPASIAAAYTAAMALWPLVAPLADERGQNDGRVAENVIIACNSASVRLEAALDIMAGCCEQVAQDTNNSFGLDPVIKANIERLHERVVADPDYLRAHVHEIVSETAKAGARQVLDLLRDRPATFARIDSTNGTALSRAYPDRLADELSKAADAGTLVRDSVASRVKVGMDDYVVNHDVYGFRLNGEKKVVLVESRGNPPWVPGIEANVDAKRRTELVLRSADASSRAIDQALAHPGLAARIEQDATLRDLFDAARTGPDLEMACCTHYPAMRSALEEVHGRVRPFAFLDQAAIVEGIVQKIDPDHADADRGDLRVVVTIGSQNYGGTPGYLKTSVPDGMATAQSLFSVIETTRRQRPVDRTSNDQPILASVQIFEQGGPDPRPGLPAATVDAVRAQSHLQQQFEGLHRVMAQKEPFRSRILADQGLVEVPDARSDQPPLRLAAGSETLQIQPRCTPAMTGIAAGFGDVLRHRLSHLGDLMTLGEARGIDKLAPYNAQGAQLAAAVARIHEIASANASRPPDEMQRVGILTGFTVVDNATGDRVGGENDGPPGAVLMARTILDQGVPVTLVTDRSSEPSLVAAVVGSGLARLTSAALARLEADPRAARSFTVDDMVLLSPGKGGLLRFEIPDHDNRARAADPAAARSAGARSVAASAERLKADNVTTMITIERPSPTIDGRMTSMLGIDISAYNLDMSPLLDRARLGDRLVTIGIGDGGNELGTGAIANVTASGRNPDLRAFVPRGDMIAATPQAPTDVMLLATVSNHAGVVLSMALEASRHEDPGVLGGRLDGAIRTYNAMIAHMHDWGMSIDGVNKVNQMSVDGRPLGSPDQARQRHRDLGGDVPLGVGPTGAATDTTHNDTFLKFRTVLVPETGMFHSRL